jgi:hypothetical protein
MNIDNYHSDLAATLAAIDRRKEQGNWIPACGGTETEFRTRTGRRLLYCWQPSTGRHAYLDLGSDIILTDEEAQLALGM